MTYQGVFTLPASLLDETLEAWRNRPLGEFVDLFRDTRYENVRQDGQIHYTALLIVNAILL